MMRVLSIVVLASLLASADAARADVYGYVDDHGELHLATEKVDARYGLFMKARDGIADAKTPFVPPTIDPKLMKTKLFQRLVDHPNIAKYEPLIRSAASDRGLDPELVKAVIAVESGFDAGAVSDKGAVGLMQVLPATGERYGVHADKRRTVEQKLKDPKLNVGIGTRYLADLLVMFPKRIDLALAAYNAGEQAVIDHRNTIPPYHETQTYVKLVDQFHAFYTPPVAASSTSTQALGARIRVTIPPSRATGAVDRSTGSTSAVAAPPSDGGNTVAPSAP